MLKFIGVVVAQTAKQKRQLLHNTFIILCSGFRSMCVANYLTSMKTEYGVSLILCMLQAIEDGNLDEMEDELRRKGRKKRRRIDDEELEETDTDKSCKKGKKRGRPPVDKTSPNPAKLTKAMKRLIRIVIEYKDK